MAIRRELNAVMFSFAFYWIAQNAFALAAVVTSKTSVRVPIRDEIAYYR